MTSSKFRDYVRKVAALVQKNHKWRKAMPQFTNRRLHRGLLGCIVLSKKRVWYFYHSKSVISPSTQMSLVRSYHDINAQDDYKCFAITLVNNCDVKPGSEFNRPEDIANEIIERCKEK